MNRPAGSPNRLDFNEAYARTKKKFPQLELLEFHGSLGDAVFRCPEHGVQSRRYNNFIASRCGCPYCGKARQVEQHRVRVSNTWDDAQRSLKLVLSLDDMANDKYVSDAEFRREAIRLLARFEEGK